MNLTFRQASEVISALRKHIKDLNELSASASKENREVFAQRIKTCEETLSLIHEHC